MCVDVLIAYLPVLVYGARWEFPSAIYLLGPRILHRCCKLYTAITVICVQFAKCVEPWSVCSGLLLKGGAIMARFVLVDSPILVLILLHYFIDTILAKGTTEFKGHLKCVGSLNDKKTSKDLNLTFVIA